MIAPTCIIAGLGMTLHLSTPRCGHLTETCPWLTPSVALARRTHRRSALEKVPGTTGDYLSNLEAKFEHAVERLRTDEFDIGFVHIKAVDDAAHDRNVTLRVRPDDRRSI